MKRAMAIDAPWGGVQNYALFASEDSRLMHEEREKLSNLERKLKDDQEEYWRAYLILHDVAAEEGKTELGRRAARLGMQCVRSISVRFGRSDDLLRADRELYLMLHWRSRPVP
jgi:hypothetical protein